jgi:hypothetical protein
MGNENNHSLAGIEYHGLPGISRECQNAVIRLLQYGDRVTRVRILSCSGDHCLLLTVNVGDLIAVKSGFGSGYVGEGSHTFSCVLQLLDSHGAEIEEYEVTQDVIDRIDNSSLAIADIENLDAARPVRPTRWHDYVFENHWEMGHDGTLWREFPLLVPFALIDSRIIDLAISFWEGPDDKLLTGYRRLEDIVRRRTRIDEHGAKLFAQAFQGPTAKLGWKGLDMGEQAGRASLFIGTFMAYRNPRAHREVKTGANNHLTEFLLLNHLFCLEKESVGVRQRQRPGRKAKASSVNAP